MKTNSHEVHGRVMSVERLPSFGENTKVGLRLELVDIWEGGSKVSCPRIDFYAKPADDLLAMGLKPGDCVHVWFRLGSFEKRDAPGTHYTTVNGWKAALSDEKLPSIEDARAKAGPPRRTAAVPEKPKLEF